MATGRTTVVVAVLAFAAGAGLSALIVSTMHDGGAPAAASPEAAPRDDGAKPERRPAAPAVPPAPRAERPREDSAAPDLRSLAPDITDDEAAFLAKALEAERTRRRESVLRPDDDGLAVMQRYLQHGADLAPLAGDFDAMRSRIRVPEGTPRRFDATGDRTAVDLSKDAGDATVIEFGPGTFVLGRGNGQWNVRQKDVAALEIRGAGMDKTRLVGPGWAFLCVNEGTSLRNLVVKDLTIDGVEQGQIVLDARGGISAALERVRIAGWQVAGHAAPLGVTGNAFLACRECEFAGPGDGFVLSCRGPALATFDRCRFVDAGTAFIGPGGTGRAAVVAVLDCTFDNTKLADSRLRGNKAAGVTVTVRRASVAAGSAGMTEEKRREWWGAANAASAEGLVFTAAKPIFPFADLVRAADLAAAAGIADVVAIEAHPGARGAPVEIDFYVFDREKGSVARRTRRLTATALDEADKEPRRGMRGAPVRSAAELDGVRPIGELLRGMGIADDDSYLHVELRPMPKGTDGVQAVWLMVQTPGGGSPVVVDAKTGAVLQKR